MTQKESYLKHNPRSEEKDVELSRKASYATLKKMEKQSGTWEEQLDAKTEKEGDEKFKEEVRELWKQLAVHGVIERDKDGKVTIKNFTDLDGKGAIGILKLAGIKGSDIEYVNPGTFKKGKTNIDTGGKHGFEVVEDEDGTITIIGDHHSDKSGRDTSATKIFYETMLALEMVEKTPALDKLVEFVTQIDNKTFPNEEKHYKDSWRTVLGLQRYFNFANLLRYFESGKSPTDILTVDELFKYRLDKPALKQEKIIETSLAEMERMEKEGLIIPSQRYGRIVVDIGKKVPSGIDAAKYFGSETYINWSPYKNGFFITSPDRGITDTFSQGFNVRKGMYMKPLADTSPLTLTLGEVLNKMTDGQFVPTGDLKKFLDKEKLLKHNKEMEKISEQPKKQNPFEEFIEAERDRLAEGEVGPAEVRAKRDLLEKVAISDNPLESLKDALSEGFISPEEFKKLKALVPEQRLQSSQPPISPETPPSPTADTDKPKEASPIIPPILPEDREPATPDLAESSAEEKRKRLTEINARIAEISRRFREEVIQGWSNVQKMHKERASLEMEKTKLIGEKEPEKTPEQELSFSEQVGRRVGQINEELDKKYHTLYQEVAVIERRPLEEEIRSLENERKNLEKGGRGFSLWKWVKERGKSLMEIPVRGEIKQAEMIRFGTKYAASLAETYGTLIEKEDTLEIDENIREMAEKQGVELSEEEFKDAFDTALKKRIDSNNDQVRRNVDYVVDVLLEQLVKARGQATAEKVLTPAKIEEIKNGLRSKMNELKNSQVSFDAKEFSKLLRKTLDKYWWLRYGYALGEILTARGIVSFVGGKLFGTKILPFASPDDIGAGAGIVSPEQLTQLYMEPGENSWTMAKEIAKKVGLENPTANQIQAIDEVFVKQNGIAVEKWGIKGIMPDISTPPGWYQTSNAVKKALEFFPKT